MKTRLELHNILQEVHSTLELEIFDLAVEKPNTDITLYIDAFTGQTRVSDCKDCKDTEIHVITVKGFDFDSEIITEFCYLDELEVVKKFRLESEYEKATDDLVNGNYTFGDFLCENGVWDSVRDDLIDNIFMNKMPSKIAIKQREYDKYVDRLSESIYFETAPVLRQYGCEELKFFSKYLVNILGDATKLQLELDRENDIVSNIYKVASELNLIPGGK